MTVARVFKIVIFIIYLQTSDAQQSCIIPNNAGQQSTVQNGAGFVQTNVNPNANNGNIKAQVQTQQPLNAQQSLNLQQLANIPMQTFNVQHVQPQQPANFQPQPSTQPVSFQQQNIVQPANLQQPGTIPPLSFQQQAVTQLVNQQQVISQPVELQQQQQIIQPVNIQQSPVVQQVHAQQVAPKAISIQPQPIPQSINVQQPTLMQPVNFQQPVQTLDQPTVEYLNVQQPQLNIQQQAPITFRQADTQQNIPTSNLGNYQVLPCQKHCQLTEAPLSMAVPLQVSTVPTAPSPAIIAAVPTSLPNHYVQQVADQSYFVDAQNYFNTLYNIPGAVVDSSHFAPVVATMVPNSMPYPSSQLVTNVPNQQYETISSCVPSVDNQNQAILNSLQSPSLITSLLSQPGSSIQSALLSIIMSSLPSQSMPLQQILPNNSINTLLEAQCSSQDSKSSIKSLLPIILSLLTEKYTNCGCRHCCKCECRKNDNCLNEPKLNTAHSNPMSYEEKNDSDELSNESEESEDGPINIRDQKKSRINKNDIPDESTEIDMSDNSSCTDDDDDNNDDDEENESVEGSGSV